MPVAGVMQGSFQASIPGCHDRGAYGPLAPRRCSPPSQAAAREVSRAEGSAYERLDLATREARVSRSRDGPGGVPATQGTSLGATVRVGVALRKRRRSGVRPGSGSCRTARRSCGVTGAPGSRACEVHAVREESPMKQPRKKGPMVRDPVCGMAVEDAPEAPRTLHEGHTYLFCSESCRERFEEARGSFAAGSGETM